MKRIFVILSCLLLLVGLSVTLPVSAAEDEIILLAGSDFQVSAHNTSRVEQVLGTLEMHGITKADGAFFCGDYTLNPDYDNQGQSSAGLSVLKKLFRPIVGNQMTFVQGNHDPADTEGLSKSGDNDPASGDYGVYVIHEDEYLQYNWDYSLGVAEQTAANLKRYLDAKVDSGWTKPIFVLSHVGLHWGNRTIKEGSAIYGSLLVDVLNEAGEKGLNIIFLYGHDHSGGIADFMGGAAIYLKKGDTMEVCTGQKKEHAPRTLKFTYMNAGYIGYYSTTEPTCDATVTMSVFRIRGDEVIVTRYDGNVNFLKEQYGIHNLKSKGVWHSNYAQEGYHATPNTLEYASSRKVTATDDVYVETPMPSNNHVHDYTPATCILPATCTLCGEIEGSALGHDYSNACDKMCDRCGYTRAVNPHKYSNKCDKICNYCGAVRKVAAHTYELKVAKKATTTQDGYSINTCIECGKTESEKVTIYKIGQVKLSTTAYTYNGKVKQPTVTVKDSKGNKISKSHYTVTYASGRKNVGTYKVTVKFKGNYSGTKTLTFKINPISISKCKVSLSNTSYTYNGSAKKPAVTVKNANGTKLTNGTHYTVTYASGRKNVGTYKVTVKMKGNYSGTKTLTFKVKPAKTTVKSLTAAKKSLKVAIIKKTAQVSGYQVQYSTTKTFKSYKTKTLSGYSKTSLTLTGLKAKTTYYVRVRTYKTVDGVKYYSGWSTITYKKTK